MPEPTDIQEQLLDAATRRFASHGYDGASLSVIAGDVGIRKPSLLYHFPSKEALREAVLGRLFARWNEVLPQILQAATGGTDRFDALVAEVVAFFTASPDRARLLLREMIDRPEATWRLFDDYLAPWLAILSDYIRRGQRDGSVRADVDADAYVLHVIHIIIGGVAVAPVFHDILNPDDLATASDRLVRETLRLARAGLFVDANPNPNE